jgi:hypothetical protein
MVRRKKPLESDFKSNLILRLRDLVEPNGYVLCLNGSYIQGFPDILILYKNRWAALECKRSSAEPYRPNQEYYLSDLDSLSFASVIFPANEEEVIDELRKALRLR